MARRHPHFLCYRLKQAGGKVYTSDFSGLSSLRLSGSQNRDSFRGYDNGDRYLLAAGPPSPPWFSARCVGCHPRDRHYIPHRRPGFLAVRPVGCAERLQSDKRGIPERASRPFLASPQPEHGQRSPTAGKPPGGTRHIPRRAHSRKRGSVGRIPCSGSPRPVSRSAGGLSQPPWNPLDRGQ